MPKVVAKSNETCIVLHKFTKEPQVARHDCLYMRVYTDALLEMIMMMVPIIMEQDALSSISLIYVHKEAVALACRTFVAQTDYLYSPHVSVNTYVCRYLMFDKLFAFCVSLYAVVFFGRSP